MSIEEEKIKAMEKWMWDMQLNRMPQMEIKIIKLTEKVDILLEEIRRK